MFLEKNQQTSPHQNESRADLGAVRKPLPVAVQIASNGQVAFGAFTALARQPPLRRLCQVGY